MIILTFLIITQDGSITKAYSLHETGARKAIFTDNLCLNAPVFRTSVRLQSLLLKCRKFWISDEDLRSYPDTCSYTKR